jgi:hypothetical protein
MNSNLIRMQVQQYKEQLITKLAHFFEQDE